MRNAELLNELGVGVYCAQRRHLEETANRLSRGRPRIREHLEEWFAGC